MRRPAVTESRAFPSRARVVIIGGGVIGTSVAYHLAERGCTDVLLLEQGQLSCGTTWHAAGLVGLLRATESGTRLVQYSTELYARLEEETGLSAGFRRCGGLIVARTPERLTQLRRTAAAAQAFGLQARMLTPGEAGERYPVMETGDLAGAIWLPDDGKANPADLTYALAKGARNRGVTIRERTRVTGILTADGAGGRAVTGVRTPDGDIQAEIVVNCAGQWAKQVADWCGVTVPLHSCEHFYVVTDQIDGIHRDLPVLRDPDGWTYFKEEVGGLVVGGFEPDAKPWVSPDQIPYPFEFQLLGEDWEHFAPLMEQAQRRIPALREAGIKKFYNGPESFTPDNQFIAGEAPGLRNFFVGAGFNSVGIASAGGAGRALAEWILSGDPGLDLTAADIRRFAPFHGNTRFLHDRVGEVLGLHYAVPWPNRELATARPLRRSPVHHLVAAAGAYFGSRMGWERPNVFAPEEAAPASTGPASTGPASTAPASTGPASTGPGGTGPVLDYSWGVPDWLPWSAAEQRAARRDVALFDQTSFSKYLLTGPDSERALQWVCTADVAVPPGRTVYTGLLNERGRYESDLTVTRLSAEEFLLVSSSATTERDQDHIRRRMPADAFARLVDVTSAYSVLGVMGPRSRDLLAALSPADLSDLAFPFGTSREIDLGYFRLRATRITYVGELGWELYVPAECAVGVFELLTGAGREFGLVHAGYYTIESMRLEKGYRAFGRELTPEYGPVEAGLLFACKLRGDVPFLGREAVEKARAEGPRRRLVSVVVGDGAGDPAGDGGGPARDRDTDRDGRGPMLWGGELLLREGVPVGQLTSAAWGEAVGRPVGLGYVQHPAGEVITPEFLRTGRYQVNAGGDVYPAAVSLRPPFDPAGARVRGL